MPPLLLDDEEAVAVAVGLQAITGMAGVEENSARALAKLEPVLPHPLRRQVSAVRDAVQSGPENTGSNAPDPEVPQGTLLAVAAAIRDHEELRLVYDGDERLQVESYRLVSWQRRWYVVVRDPRTDEWRSLRLDWLELRTPGGRRFTPTGLPGEDYPGFVLRTTAAAGWRVHHPDHRLRPTGAARGPAGRLRAVSPGDRRRIDTSAFRALSLSKGTSPLPCPEPVEGHTSATGLQR